MKPLITGETAAAAATTAVTCALLALSPTAVGGFRGGAATTRRPAFLARPGPPSCASSSILRSRPPSKGDFYDDGELSDLLSLHEALVVKGDGADGDGSGDGGQSDEEGGLDFDPFPVKKPDDGSSSPDAFSIPGIHDLVLQTVREIDDGEE